MQTAATTAAATSTIARLYEAFTTLLEKLQPPFALAIRVYVGKVFILSGWLKLSRWDSTLALFQNEYHVPLLPPSLAAVVGTASELTLPTLLLIGLGSRAAALALFVFNIVAVISYPDLSDAGLQQHILWGALMLVIAFYGAGKWSIDRWIGLR